MLGRRTPIRSKNSTPAQASAPVPGPEGSPAAPAQRSPAAAPTVAPTETAKSSKRVSTVSLNRRMVGLLLLAMIPLAVVGWLAAMTYEQNLTEQIVSGLAGRADLEAARIEDEMARVRNIADAMAADAEVVAALRDQRRSAGELAGDAVTAMRNTEYNVKSLTLVRNDFVAGSTTATPPPISPELYDQARVRTAFGVTRRVTAKDDRLPVVSPVFDDLGSAQPLGWLIIERDLTPIIEQMLAHHDLGKTTEAMLVQPNGSGAAQHITALRFAPDAAFNKFVNPDSIDHVSVDALSQPVTQTIEAFDYRNEITLSAYRSIADTGWGLIVKIDRTEAYDSVDAFRKILQLNLGLVGLGLLGTLFIISRSFGRRLTRIRTATESITAGDLDARIHDDTNDEIGVLATALDTLANELSEDRALRADVEARLLHQANHDHLTGLPNRAQFLVRLDGILRETAPGTVAVLFCDLDGFKPVNDELGHSVGDLLLQAVAQRFHSALLPGDILARFGGDEFIVMARNGPGQPGPDELARRIQASISEPIVLGGAEIRVSTSVGVAVSNAEHTAETLVRDADVAMYQAKETGKGNLVRSSDEMIAKVNNRLSEATELRRAIDQNELRLLYQPFVSLSSGRITGVEALVRWQHPRRGLLGPGKFVPAADAAGLGNRMGLWILAEGCRELGNLLRAGLVDPSFVMSINLTTSHLSDPALPDVVTQLIQQNQIPAGNVQLEITEHALVGDDRVAEMTLQKLHEAGVRLAIDDFGTYHSNLDRLRRFPVDVVKIDQSFVQNIDADRGNYAIAQAIVSVASALELKVVAEGIETPVQASILAEMNCHDGQGFLFAIPMTSTDMSDYLVRARNALVSVA